MVQKRHFKSVLIFAIFLFLGFVMFLSFIPCRPIVLVWPANQSQNSKVLSRPEKNTTILAPSTFCNRNTENSDQNLVILVIVFSAMSNFQERQTIRDSWASELVSVPRTKVIFFARNYGKSLQ